MPKYRPYQGIRFTADGFDCALPVAIDSHSVCSYNCAYCFSEQLVGRYDEADRKIGEMSLKRLDNIFGGQGGKFGAVVREALRYDKVDGKKFEYPCPVQLGAINDPCDGIEEKSGWLLDFIQMAIRHKQPVRISTKGTVLGTKPYLDALAKAPHLFWIAWSINTIDDSLAKTIDKVAPVPSERLKAMAAVTDLGCSASLRCRPMFPGLTDRTKNHPNAYKELVEAATVAGAGAVSYECGFIPMRFQERQRKRWEEMENTIGIPLKSLYKNFGRAEACLRPSASWTEPIMHAMRDVAHDCGLTVGVSDPTWKQLTDVGCCCGIRPDDKVFGNWERENATNAIVTGREEGRLLKAEDIIPPWAWDVKQGDMCALQPGPKQVYQKRHRTWGDYLFDVWNDPKATRGPVHYFQGALEWAGQEDNGSALYKYVGLERHNHETPFWNV